MKRAIYLAALVLIGCGEDMGQKHLLAPYKKISHEQIGNNRWVESATTSQLVNNTLSNYELSRRQQQTNLHNYNYVYGAFDNYIPLTTKTPGTTYMIAGKRYNLVKFDARGMLTGAGRKVRLAIYPQTFDVGNDITLYFSVGRYATELNPINCQLPLWQFIDLDVDPFDPNDPLPVSIDVQQDTGTAEWVNIYSMAIYDLEDRTRPEYVNLSSSLIGTENYPVDAAMLNIMNDQNEYLHATRGTGRLISKCFIKSGGAAPAAVAADYRGYGSYSLLKSSGSTTLNFFYRYAIDGDAGTDKMDVTVRLYAHRVLDYDGQTGNFTEGEWIYGTTSGSKAKILYDNDAGATGTLHLAFATGRFQNGEALVSLSGGAADANGADREPAGGEYISTRTDTLTWASDEWEWQSELSFAGLIDGEAEYELRVDAAINADTPDNFYISNIFVWEDLTGSDGAYVLPAVSFTEPNDDVLIETFDRIKDTQAHVYNRGRHILVNDYRFNDVRVSSADYAVLAHGVAWPSYKSEYMICRALISKPNYGARVNADYSNLAGGNFTVGETVYQQIKTNGGSWATIATGKILDDDNGGGAVGTVYIGNVNGAFQGNAGVAAAEMKIIGASSSAEATLDFQNVTVDPRDIQTKLKFGFLVDANSITYASSMTFYEEHDIVNRSVTDEPFEVWFKVKIPQSYWNDSDPDNGAMPGPYIFALLGAQYVAGTAINYDMVRPLVVQTYEAPLSTIKE